MEKMTIHRALTELKTIGSRIETLIDNLNPSGVQQKDKLVNGNEKREDFEATAKSRFQAINDLISRRNKIKSAIVKANGETEVKIAGNVLTIADAINLKAVIVFKKKLIETMKKRHNQAKANLEKNNAQVEANALQLATVALGKQGVKIGDDDAQSVIKPYLEANTFQLVNPLDAEKNLADMEKEISDFETDVDATLSEVNAITTIEF